MKESLPIRIRKIRTQHGLSQEQMAAKLNVSFATVNRWETGKSLPQKAQLEALHGLFGEVELSDAGDFESADGASPRRTRRGLHKSSVLGNKSMEQMLWDAACSIRGEKDAPKF